MLHGDRSAVAARARAAYLGLALGDALGATVEFMTPREIAADFGVQDTIRGGGWLRLRPGQVTDDTGMALAVGRAILAAGHVDALAIAHALDGWMRSKPVDIGNTVRRGLLHFRRTGEVEAPESAHDAGNGAAVRVLAVALATLGQPEAAVRAACRVQGHVTHHNALSDAAAECLALMVQDALGGATRLELLNGRAHRLAQGYPAFAFRDRRRTNPSAYVVETLQAVFQALFDTDSLEDCLVDVVNRGGDADTTGAIAGMLAGAIDGPQALPRRWLSALAPEIRQACEAQAGALLRLEARREPSRDERLAAVRIENPASTHEARSPQ